MKKTKRFISCILAAAIMMAVTGCGNKIILKSDNSSSVVSGTQTAINYSYDKKSSHGSSGKAVKPDVELTPAAEYYLKSFDDKVVSVYKQLYNGMLNFVRTIDVTDGVISKEDIGGLLELCLSSSPELNYIGQEYTVSIDSENYVTAVTVTYKKSKEEASAENKALIGRVKAILSGVSEKWDDYKKVKYFHDAIIQNCEYSEDGRDPYSAYGCLYDGKAVCEGYTKAMQLLCDNENILCVPVAGKGKTNDQLQPHIWNKIKIDGKWYAFDLTWDDPVSDFETSYVRYDYFGLNDEQMERDHIAQETKFMSYPKASDTYADYFRHSNLFCDDASKAQQLLKKTVENVMINNGTYVRIKCSDKNVYDNVLDEIFNSENNSNAKIFSILSECVENGNDNYSKYGYSLIKNDVMYTITIKLSMSD